MAGLDPRVEPGVITRDGFEIAMWAYFEQVPSSEHAPVEYAHALGRLHGAMVPNAVSERYRDADQDLVGDYRGVVLALVAAHRSRRDDQHPSGRQSGSAFLDGLRRGPPWPALDDINW